MSNVLEIELLDGGVLPEFQNENDACFDLTAAEDYTLKLGKVTLVRTGLKMGIPKGFEVQIRPRSGLALKHGVTVLNSPGTIDSGYDQEVGVILLKIGVGTKDKTDQEVDFYHIKKFDRIAQARLVPLVDTDLKKVDKLSIIGRNGGFGSTGK